MRPWTDRDDQHKATGENQAGLGNEMAPLWNEGGVYTIYVRAEDLGGWGEVRKLRCKAIEEMRHQEANAARLESPVCSPVYYCFSKTNKEHKQKHPGLLTSHGNDECTRRC